MKRPTSPLIAVILTLTAAAGARAGQLAPGETGRGPDFYYGFEPPVDGEVIDTVSAPFEVSVMWQGTRYFQQGTLTQQVYREDDGRLAFLYLYDETAAANATADVVSLAATGFTGFTTDAYADVFFPPVVSRSADGDRITSVDGGEGDAGLLVRTNATAYVLDGTGPAFTAMVRFQGNGGGSPDQPATLGTFRPVPEPSSAALLAAAAPLALGRRRARR